MLVWLAVLIASDSIKVLVIDLCWSRHSYLHFFILFYSRERHVTFAIAVSGIVCMVIWTDSHTWLRGL